MAKKIDSKKVKRSVASGLNFSKFYFSKSTSIVLITSYSVILVLAFAVLGFSGLISAPSVDESVPKLPEKEPFAFLPADNPEVPVLGDVETPSKETENTTEAPASTESTHSTEETIPAPKTIETPAVAEAPAIAEPQVKIVEKAVVKEVPKKVVKVVEKEVVKEVIKETPAEKLDENAPKEPEKTYYDNYAAPEIIAPVDEYSKYQNFPDKIEEVSKEDEISSEQ